MMELQIIATVAFVEYVDALLAAPTDESRSEIMARLAEIETQKADKLPRGDQDALRKSARDHEFEAYSADWRHSK